MTRPTGKAVRVMNFKILVDHAKDCRAMQLVEEGIWESPWFFGGEWVKREHGVEPRLYLDSIGRPGRGGRPWLVAMCNNAGRHRCSARIAVREDFILELLPKREGKKNTRKKGEGRS